MLAQGFERPKETQATFHGRLECLKELHAARMAMETEESDLAQDLATCGLPHVVADVSSVLGISRAQGYRRYHEAGEA
ncbi:hypothetical protein PUR49_11395 [Streptomyces sp. BE147]|uniref:hypothetical protein n=1 Tax=Streptomyces sp. BE147 TaxID=3002524 RepID=UPI002E7679EA|nr:hypothetical protein [Streptomyces sp. BE147]MEE1737096.1 hypothetical protein [Streptomyces sp. BE147]